MSVPVTVFLASTMGIWLLILSARVIKVRQSDRVSLGDDGNEQLLRRMRAQGNLTEYAPCGIGLVLIAELQGVNIWIVAALAAVFGLGRLLHGYSLSFSERNIPFRVGGMLMTLTSIGLLSIANLLFLFLKVPS